MILAIVFFVKSVFEEFIAKSLEFVARTLSVCNDMANVFILVLPELKEKSNNLNKDYNTSIAKEEYHHSIHFMDLLDEINKIISKAMLKILSILNFSSMPFDKEKAFNNNYNKQEIRRTTFDFYYTI